MSEIRLLGGRSFNLLERGTVTMSPVAATVYPASRLYDGAAEWPARFGTLVDNAYVGVDLDLLHGSGNMDSWSAGLPAGSGWTKSGTVAADTVTKQAGASSAKVSNGQLVATMWVRAGEKLRIDCYLRGDATNAIGLKIQNLQTGLYYAAGVWAASAAFATQTAAAFAQVTATPTMESSQVCRTDLVQLEITAYGAAGDGWIDELTVVPYVDWCSVHGHNLDPIVVAKLRYAELASYSGVVVAGTFALKRRACYMYLSTPVAARYWQCPSLARPQNTAATGPAQFGEVILGQSITVATGMDLPIEIERDRPQTRVMSGSGGEGAVATSGDLVRRLTLRATTQGRTAWDALAEILEITGQGLYPLVIAPEVGGDSDSDAETVVFGRLANPVPVRRPQHLARSLSITLREFPFPG